MKLLFAEDEKELSRAVATILEFQHFEVDAVYDGEAALEAAIKNNYDGIILDIMMPKMDGISVLKELRHQGNPTPILMLTAKAEVEDKILGLDEGANDYLAKPFAMKELVARIKAMTRNVQRMLPEEIKVSNIVIDREQLQLSSEVSSVGLNMQEFRMLELFMNNIDIHFSKSQLYEKVWKENDEGDGIVDIYVSYIRNKLESVEANVSITKNDNAYLMTLA